MKLLDSDDEEENQSMVDSAVQEREAIANELFEGDEDVGEVNNFTIDKGQSLALNSIITINIHMSCTVLILWSMTF